MNSKNVQETMKYLPVKSVRLILGGLLLTSLMIANVRGQSLSSARAVALGSAYTGLAKGVDAARFNPANLGLTSHRQSGIELVGVGANVSNNSFTLDDYNTYTGAFLTDEDKEYILGQVPDEGLKVTAEVEASALALSFGPTVVAVSGIGVADINLNRDLLELVMNGNTFADTIEVTGSYSEGMAIAAASLSYGMPLLSLGSKQLAVGATVKYLHGFGIERVIEIEGLAATYASGFAGEGKLIAQTATGGQGYALDLGTALKLSPNYTVGARIKNLYSSMTWNKETEEHGYIFSFDTMTVDNMNEDYVVSEDYSIDIDDFSTTLPSTMNIGLAKDAGSLLWAIDWEQGFRKAAGASTKPRLSVGTEWRPIGLIPLRAGYSTGGGHNTAFSFGSGFHLPLFYIDYAVVTGSSISGYSSKGVNVAVTTGLYF